MLEDSVRELQHLNSLLTCGALSRDETRVVRAKIRMLAKLNEKIAPLVVTDEGAEAVCFAVERALKRKTV